MPLAPDHPPRIAGAAGYRPMDKSLPCHTPEGIRIVPTHAGRFGPDTAAAPCMSCSSHRCPRPPRLLLLTWYTVDQGALLRTPRSQVHAGVVVVVGRTPEIVVVVVVVVCVSLVTCAAVMWGAAPAGGVIGSSPLLLHRTTVETYGGFVLTVAGCGRWMTPRRYDCSLKAAASAYALRVRACRHEDGRGGWRMMMFSISTVESEDVQRAPLPRNG